MRGQKVAKEIEQKGSDNHRERKEVSGTPGRQIAGKLPLLLEPNFIYISLNVVCVTLRLYI